MSSKLSAWGEGRLRNPGGARGGIIRVSTCELRAPSCAGGNPQTPPTPPAPPSERQLRRTTQRIPRWYVGRVHRLRHPRRRTVALAVVGGAEVRSTATVPPAEHIWCSGEGASPCRGRLHQTPSTIRAPAHRPLPTSKSSSAGGERPLRPGPAPTAYTARRPLPRTGGRRTRPPILTPPAPRTGTRCGSSPCRSSGAAGPQVGTAGSSSARTGASPPSPPCGGCGGPAAADRSCRRGR